MPYKTTEIYETEGYHEKTRFCDWFCGQYMTVFLA
jgi:hypothetical protein